MKIFLLYTMICSDAGGARGRKENVEVIKYVRKAKRYNKCIYALSYWHLSAQVGGILFIPFNRWRNRDLWCSNNLFWVTQLLSARTWILTQVV